MLAASAGAFRCGSFMPFMMSWYLMMSSTSIGGKRGIFIGQRGRNRSVSPSIFTTGRRSSHIFEPMPLTFFSSSMFL